MKGYYNQPEATAEAMRDGWFHTGDIGHLDADGYLVITDRKKDIIVTAGGKNVAPQPIESRLKTDKFLSEVIVLGDRRPYLVALVVPNFENLASYARLKGIRAAGASDLVRQPAIREFLEGRIARLQEGSASFECIKKLHILDRDLEIGAELTPTLQVKRKEIARRFHDEIEALYGS
jgi:long-chain acyl-CoA synthetase